MNYVHQIENSNTSENRRNQRDGTHCLLYSSAFVTSERSDEREGRDECYYFSQHKN